MLPRPRPPADDAPAYIGYIRVSTWKEEKISPELQETAIRAWADRRGVRLLEPLVVDLDTTGRNFRRKIMGAIRRVEGGEAQGIAVWKYSRFGRSRDGVSINLKRLEDAGGQLQSATEEVDAATATGRLQRGILFEFAAYESDVRGEQWREAHDHRRYKLHLPASGRPRFGYIWTPRRVADPAAPSGWRLQDEAYTAHPETGPVMADRYRQYVDGQPFYALMADLNAAGWRTVRGGPWSQQTLMRYMDSGFCAGLLRVHNPACKCPQEERGNCGNTLFIPGAQEELIDAELWQMYRERRTAVKATPPRARAPLYPCTNLMRCGGCRGTTPAQSAQRASQGVVTNIRGYSYACGRRSITGTHGCPGVWATRAHVEAEVRRWVEREVAPAVDAAGPIPAPRTAEVDQRAAAARERARLEVESSRLADGLANLRADHAMNPADYGPGEYEAARDKIRQQQQVTTAALERVSAVETAPHRADYDQLLIGLLDAWHEMHDSEKNALLKQVIRRVVLVRTDGTAKVEVHPVWESDPWAATEVATTA
ncbi:serine integrase [Streptomyces phage HFrancette]|uniref:Serine integrase n=1 Tax=Streptomyces phage HFrancette TaxID=2926108 RepID=A0A9E7T1B4_9CAUD|nr:serine integrase [Streptomyces phage HFrancette]UTN92124.1 serine integrase [Streptomyces phage HFrancette]